jgi:hypothetical protein
MKEPSTKLRRRSDPRQDVALDLGWRSHSRALILPNYVRRDRGWLDDASRAAFITVLNGEGTRAERFDLLKGILHQAVTDNDSVYRMLLLPMISEHRDYYSHLFRRASWNKNFADAQYDVLSSSDGTRAVIVVKTTITAERQVYDIVAPRIVLDDDPVQGRGSPEQHDLSEPDLSEARRLLAEARKLGFTVERAIETLEREAKAETTGRASPEPRPKITGNSPRRRKRYVFTEQELHDPATVDRARDILADAEERRRTGQPTSEAQTKERRWADAFTRKFRKINGPEVT